MAWLPQLLAATEGKRRDASRNRAPQHSAWCAQHRSWTRGHLSSKCMHARSQLTAAALPSVDLCAMPVQLPS